MYNRQCEYFVINDDVAECVKKVKKIIPAECELCKCREEEKEGCDKEWLG